jgi:bifunctional non-homologous end joining protein LigD
VRRREILKKLLPKEGSIRFSDAIEGRGIEFFRAARERGLEGIMAKRKGSRYLPGRRSENWLKIKARMQQEAVIGGITEPSGGRHYFEALMLGVYDKGRLLYVGHTGTGFSEPLLKDLFAKLRPYFTNRCPFTPKPKGLRDDKDPFVADHQHILLWRNVVTDRQVKLRGNGFGCSGRS